jgi:hypothetical protein
VSLVTQHTDYLSGECLIKQFDNRFAIGGVTFGHRSLFDMTARSFAQSFNVSEKWFITHDSFSCVEFSECVDITRLFEDGASGAKKRPRQFPGSLIANRKSLLLNSGTCPQPAFSPLASGARRPLSGGGEARFPEILSV